MVQDFLQSSAWNTLTPDAQSRYKSMYLVDNGANVSMVCHADSMWNVQPIPPTTVTGIGTTTLTQEGSLHFGSALLNPEIPFNIIAQWQLEALHRVQKDTQVSTSYLIDNIVECRRHSDNT